MDKFSYLGGGDPGSIDKLYELYQKDPDSVGFLAKVKEFIETPIQLLFEGMYPERILLGS
ncbi:hypothetical protein ES708_05486 [subsurface metagenome]